MVLALSLHVRLCVMCVRRVNTNPHLLTSALSDVWRLLIECCLIWSAGISNGVAEAEHHTDAVVGIAHMQILAAQSSAVVGTDCMQIPALSSLARTLGPVRDNLMLSVLPDPVAEGQSRAAARGAEEGHRIGRPHSCAPSPSDRCLLP